MLIYELKPLDFNLSSALNSIDVDPCAVKKFKEKSNSINIYIKDIKTSWANIIKQEMLSLGGDAAISKNAYDCSKEKTDVLLIGNKHILNKFIVKLNEQPTCFSNLSIELNNLVNKNTNIFKVKDKVFDFNNDFLVMGVLNLTPDSFSDGGKFNTIDLALKKVAEFVDNKTDIIDIGAVSTRPGASIVSTEEELERLMPILAAIKKNFNILISLDSHNPKVIKEALNFNIDIVNDISSGSAVFDLIDAINNKNVSLILMNNNSSNLLGEKPNINNYDVIDNYLNFKLAILNKLNLLNFDTQKLCLDPGIGFGLSIKNITKLIKNIKSINQVPLLIGLSRKSYFNKLLETDTFDKDFVSNATSLLLMQEGVRFFRTHDSKGIQTMIKLFKSIREDL